MTWIPFLAAWFFLLYASRRSKSHFLFFFVLCQFVFIGIGLFLFPFFGLHYLERVFPSFNLSSIDLRDFYLANILVIGSTSCTIIIYKILLFGTLNKKRYNITNTFSTCIKSFTIPILVTSIVVITSIHTYDNFLGFKNLMLATEISDLGSFVDLRRDSTTNYIITLIVYNLLPASTILILLFFLEKKTKVRACIFSLSFILTSLSLLLTYQKRPLLLFWGLSALAAFLYNEFLNGKKIFNVSFYDFIMKQKILLISIVFMLFSLYFVYTGFRFQAGVFSVFLVLGEIVFTRLIGRLSLPAAMYVDFFPAHHDFYGLSNVGLLAKISGNASFLDTKEVFFHYANNQLDGSVAASIFIDAYGQGGFYISIFYALFLGLFIWAMDFIAFRLRDVSKKVFFIITGFLFLYYLSQASLFRASFGYGGIFYFLIWICCFRFRVRHLLSVSITSKKQHQDSL